MGDMTVPQPLQSRLIGALFVERGLVSESQIRVALELQRETGQQLGQILVERYGVSRKELASVVAEQWAKLGGSAGPEDNASWRRLGEIFVERGFVSQEELEQALERQRQTGERLGEALVAQGVISKFELAGALAEQMATLGEEEKAAAAAAEQPQATVHQLPRPNGQEEVVFGAVMGGAAESVDQQQEHLVAVPDPDPSGDVVPLDLATRLGLVDARRTDAVEPEQPVADEAPEAVLQVADVAEDEEIAEAEEIGEPIEFVGEAEGTEVREVAEIEEVEEVAEAIDVSEGAEVSAVSGLAEAAAVTDIEEVAEAVEVSEAIDVVEVAVVTDIEEAAEIADGTEAFEIAAAPADEVLEHEPAPAADALAGEPASAELVVEEDAAVDEAATVEAPEPVVADASAEARARPPRPLPTLAFDDVAEPETSSTCVAYAPTPRGYRLVPLGTVPSPGETIDVPDVGERLVLRVGASPLPDDDRVCAFVEEPVVWALTADAVH